MENLIASIKKRLCYESSWWLNGILALLYGWKLFFYVGVPVLILRISLNSHITIMNQFELGDRLDRIEAALEINDAEYKNLEARNIGDYPAELRKWVWSCNWSIHDKDWDFDDGAFGESVSDCGAGNQAWKEKNWMYTRAQALALRNKHNEETGHKAWIGENLTLTPSK